MVTCQKNMKKSAVIDLMATPYAEGKNHILRFLCMHVRFGAEKRASLKLAGNVHIMIRATANHLSELFQLTWLTWQSFDLGKWPTC